MEVCKPVLRSLRKNTLKKLSQVRSHCSTSCKAIYLKQFLPAASQGRQRALVQAPQAYTVHRLVPKVKGLRPIANLGKRIKLVSHIATSSMYGRCLHRHFQITPDGIAKWLPSINQVLENPYEALNIAKVCDRSPFLRLCREWRVRA